MSILFILLFIFCLSLLVCVHELGHLTAAKIFKVYCFEYSIGFGPKLFSKKRKGGETTFSLRAVPFGGYVSMYGEGVEVPEGLTIPEERSLNGVKKWKRAIILFAGVFMNAVLALVLFFISNTCFQQRVIHTSSGVMKESSPYYSELETDPSYQNGMLTFDLDEVKENSYVYYIDKEAVVTYNTVDSNPLREPEPPKTASVAMVLNVTDVLGYDQLEWDYYLQFYFFDEGGEDFRDQLVPDATINHIDFKLSTLKYNETEQKWDPSMTHDFAVGVVEKGPDEKGDMQYEWSKMDLGFYLEKFHYGFGDAVKETFVDYGNSSTAIFRGLGALITSQEARNQIGGIVAIGFVSTSALTKYGLNTFIRIWALISVNLVIMNLLPFPGLDGWQLLVLIVEGVAHKEIPAKVKNIVSFVGIVLLMGLMFLLLVKDFWTYIL